jgi:DNA-binding transcriptional MerR regulator
MGYRIGEVAGFLDITTDTIRFYEKEGIIRPTKNPLNGYREYSFEDITRLSDVLFYRNVDFSIGDIRHIVNGVSSEDMLTMIRQKEGDIKKSLAVYRKLLIKMQTWEKLHQEALDYENKFEIRPMPPSYHKQTYRDKDDIDIKELNSSIPVSPKDVYFVTLSFRTGLTGRDAEHYFALDTEYSQGLDVDFQVADMDMENHPKCLFTVCKYQENLEKMLAPAVAYLKRQGLSPEGMAYGRQNVVTYDNEKMVEHYRIYIPLKDREPKIG